jgi:hypothetical protein
MGFLSASSTIVRLHAAPPAKVDRETVLAGVSRRAFREESDTGLPHEEVFGWVDIHDPMETRFDTTDLFFQQYLLLGFRYDRRTIPTKLAWMERRQAERERREKDGLDRLSLSIRREIRDEVDARLLQKALPTPRLFECAWNLDTGVIYFTTRTGPVMEAFSTTFRETFGLTPTPMIPYLTAEHIGLDASVLASFRASTETELTGNQAGADAGEDS